MDTDAPTIDAVLREHASRVPDKRLYAFLDIEGQIVASLSYHQLDQRARHIAQVLRAHAVQGSRVLLLFWPGLEFAAALYGCLYAGMVAVPAYPPEPNRLERTLSRLKAIAMDAAPAVVLTSSDIHAMAKSLLAFAPDFAKLPWLAVDALESVGLPPAEMESARSAQDLAVIQYTSGSTARPKGVKLSHRNILTNMRMIQIGSNQDQSRIFMSWLPTYHDLGLMGGIILPAMLGASSILTSPLDFLRRPSLWLSSISRYRATDTFAPNFALDLAARKITGPEREALDLSSLKVCIVGAEPVRHASIERFIHAFGKRGLARDSIAPCYGLAEAVLAVSGGPVGESLRSIFVDADALADHRFVTAEPNHPSAQPIVSCGRPLTDLDVRIVTPTTRQPAQPGEVGEVWIRGPSVALGYWQREEDHYATFEAHIDGDTEQSWLRTGDLGHIEAGHLYITGRIKDLIVVRGKNYYPQDIELTVEGCHPRVRPGATIAFAFEHDDTEQLVVVTEVDARHPHTDAEKRVALEQVVAAIRSTVHAEHALLPHNIVLIKARTIDKTSSGKLARQNCRRRFTEGTLDAEYTWTATPARLSERLVGHVPVNDVQLPQPKYVEHQRDMVERVTMEIVRLAKIDERTLSPETRLTDLGLDSLGAMELIGYIEQTFGVALPINTLLNSRTISELVAHIEQLESDGAGKTDILNSHASIAQIYGVRHITLREWQIPAPLFCIGGLGGTASYLSHLGLALDGRIPCIAFQAPGVDGHEAPLGSVEEMARRYIEEMRTIQPQGPYAIAGHSFGGLVAYEMAQQLAEEGQSVAPLLLLDASPIESKEPSSDDDEIMALFELSNMYHRFAGNALESETLAALAPLSTEQQRHMLRQSLGVTTAADHVLAIYRASHSAMLRYRPRYYGGAVFLFLAERGFPDQAIHPGRRLRHWFDAAVLGWDRLCPALQVIKVPGDHFSMVMPPHAAHLASAMQGTLEKPAHMSFSLDRLLPSSRVRPHGRALEVSPGSIRFDPHHPAYIEDPYPYLNQLRELSPICQDAMSFWWVTRHADVSAGLRNKSLSVDARRLGDRQHPIADGSAKPPLLSSWFRHQETVPLARLYNDTLLFLDPPRHTLIRKIFAPLFSPEAIQRLIPSIDERIHELMTGMRLRRDPDLMRDLALPLPVSVISTIYGIPREDSSFIAQWTRDMSLGLDTAVSNQAFEQANRSAENFTRYLIEHVAYLRKAPKSASNGMPDIDEILRSGLSMNELIANMAITYFAGFETTTNAIGNGTLALLRHPDQLKQLRENPGICENAVEELLRYDCPVRYTPRTALDDMDIGGQPIRRGDTVMLVLASANRDPIIFPDPDRLDIGRDAKHHVAFSHGPHYCLGAALARVELQRVFSALSRQHFALIPGGLVWRNSLTFRSLEQFQMTWVY